MKVSAQGVGKKKVGLLLLGVGVGGAGGWRGKGGPRGGRDYFLCTWLISHSLRMCIYICIYIWYTCVHVCIYKYVHLDDFTCLVNLRSIVCNDSFICVTWLIHMCDMTHSYVCHDSFMCVQWLIHMCAMTHSYVCHDSFICVTWLIHMCDIPCQSETKHLALNNKLFTREYICMYKYIYIWYTCVHICMNEFVHLVDSLACLARHCQTTGWLRLVGSIKL